MNRWTDDAEKIARTGLKAGILYAITNTLLGLIDFAGRLAILAIALLSFIGILHWLTH